MTKRWSQKNPGRPKKNLYGMTKPNKSVKENAHPREDQMTKWERADLESTHSNSDLNFMLKSSTNSFHGKNYNRMEDIVIGKRKQMLESSHDTNSKRSLLLDLPMNMPQVGPGPRLLLDDSRTKRNSLR